MTTVLMCVILIPLLGQIVRFWVQAAKWGVKNQRSLGERIQRVRSALAEGVEE